VIFSDSAGSGNTSVDLIGTLNPASVTVADPTLNYSFYGNGFIANGNSASLTKSGAGTLNLANSTTNTYTGMTAVLSGLLNVNLGNLSVPTNLINSSSPLLMYGGSLDVIGGSTTSLQTFNPTNLEGGGSSITASGAASTTIALNFITRNQGSTVNFTLPATGAITTTSGNGYSSAPAILGGYAIVSGSGWATVNGSSDIVALSPSGYTNNIWSPVVNTNITSSITNAASGITQSLRFNTPGTDQVTLNNGASILSGGILVTSGVGANNPIIVGGTLTSLDSQNDLIINQYDTQGILVMASTLVNNGANATGLTESGPGASLVDNGNTYTGPTTINGGVLDALALANGGTNSSIGASSNAAGNLVLNGGTLQFTGGAGTGITNRQFTLGPNGGTLDGSATGSALNFTNTGLVAFSNDAPTSLTLTGTYGNGTSTYNVFNSLLNDPDAPGLNKTTLVKSGPGTWFVGNNSNTYSGGTIINGGVLKTNDPSYTPGSSALGVGPITVNNTGTLGGNGPSTNSYFTGATTVNGGGSLVPGDPTNMIFENGLTLNPGAGLTYTLNNQGLANAGPPGGNDLITSTGNVTIATNIPVTINPTNSFGTGIYSLIQYGSLTDNSSNFTGWTANLSNNTTSFTPGVYYNMGFSNNYTGDNIDLIVTSTGTTNAPTLTTNSTSTTVVFPAGYKINNANINNPIISIKAPVKNGNIGGNGGNGGNNNTFNFYMANGGYFVGGNPAPKGFSFGWVPVIAAIPAGTPYFNISTLSATQTTPDPNTAAGGANLGGWAYAGLQPPGTALGGALNSGLGPNAGLPDTGIPYGLADAHDPFAPFNVGPPAAYPAAQVGPIAGNVWLPAYTLAPLIIVTDPPATPTPTYYGETFANPNGDLAPYLALDENGTLEPAISDDTLSGLDGTGSDTYGEDAVDNYQGSFLSLIQSDFGDTSPSQLTTDQWDMLDGSFGVDPVNDVAWAVDDAPDADYTVVAIGLPEPGSLSLLAIGGAGLLARRRRRKSS
jgi:autotransporter-associated beta strand protein